MAELLQLLQTQPLLFSLISTILGLIFGSFLNVVILRLPPRLEYHWKQECADYLDLRGESSPAPPGLVFQASHCPQCGHALKPWENIPLLSWLWLRGRCSQCRQPISWQYPLVELLTGLALGWLGWHFGPSLHFLAAAFFTLVLIALAGIDIRTQLLPDQLTLPLLWAGLLYNLQDGFVPLDQAVIGAAAGYLSLWSVYWLFKLATGKEGMGHGDFKLLATLGAWLGWQMLPLIILLSAVVGLIFALLMMLFLRHDRRQPIPFGPYLAAAGWIALIWGTMIVERYLQALGI